MPCRSADRQAAVATRQHAGQMLAVAAEELVSAHPGQDDLDPALPCRLAHQQRVDRGRIADRLVEHVHDSRQHADDVRGDLDLVQVDAVPRRDLAGVDRVVRHCLQPLVLGPEGDGVRVDVRVRPVRQDRHDAGIQAAGQEAGDRHVGDQVRRDRLLDHRAQVSGLPGGGLGRDVGDLPVRLHVGRAVRPEAGPGPGGQLAHLVDGTALLGQPVIEHRGDQRARLDPQLGADGRDQRLELGGEHHAVAARQVVQRLDAERVPGQDQVAGALVDDGEREHAAEPAQRIRSPAPPRLEHHLGVGRGGEPDAAGGQLGPQRPVVVQLAVVDDGQAVLAQRLIGGAC